MSTASSYYIYVWPLLIGEAYGGGLRLSKYKIKLTKYTANNDYEK